MKKVAAFLFFMKLTAIDQESSDDVFVTDL